MHNKALFLDRDGVINIDHGYVHKIEHFEFVDGIFDLCFSAISKGYLICVITNQAGIGRGLYSEADFNILTDWMCEKFAAVGIFISGIYFSPFHPKHGIGKYLKNDYSRKPNPGMLFEAQSDLDIDMDKSIFIGDNITDMEAGITAGVGKNILLQLGDTNLKLRQGEFVRVCSLIESEHYL